MMTVPRRFATLDALRGIAAIGVMLWHTPGHPIAIQGGYLAVDLFFGISGFVMALNYEDRLRRGMPVARFMALRAARLWPMLCIGVLPGLIVLNGWLSAPAAAPAAPAPAGAEVPAGLALIFPVNPAYWSLLFEMLAYLGFALAAHRLKVAGLVWVMAISALALAGMTVWGSNLLHEYGSFWATFPHGLARVGYSFTCGVLVYRLRLAGGMPAVTSSLAWAVPGGLVAVMLLVPVPGQLAGLLGVLLALPALLWLATKWEVPQHRLADGLSDLSYPLYCLHMPCLVLASIFGMPMVLAWVAMASASLLLDRWVDRPLRDMLRGSVLAGVARPKAA